MRAGRLLPFVAASFLLVGLAARAHSREDIVFPVKELGNCASEAECRTYCDQRADLGVIRSCLAFARKHNLLPAEEIDRAEKFSEVVSKGGPGMCKNEAQCRAYCEDIAHLPECIAFIDKYDLKPDEDIAEGRKIASALKAGAKPPGGCKNKQSCLTYCDDPSHAEECVSFAEAAGLIPADDLAKAKKFLPAIKNGETPGKCAREAECRAYCEQKEHLGECLDFGEKYGLISSEEAALARKVGGAGPGGCTSADSCAAFCNNPENHPACIQFAAEHGFLDAEEASQVYSLSDFQSCIPSAPDSLKSCLRSTLGDELFDSLLKGAMPMDPRRLEDTIARVRRSRGCLDEVTQEVKGFIGDNPEALACIREVAGEDFLTQMKSGKLACRAIGDLQSRVAECIKKATQAKFESCFTKPCAESIACFKGASNQSTKYEGEGYDSGQSDPRIKERVQSCMFEMMNACFEKSCAVALDCVQAIGGRGEEKTEESGTLPPVLQSKMTACVKELASQQQEGATVQTYTQPSPEQYPYPTPEQYQQPTYPAPEQYNYPTPEQYNYPTMPTYPSPEEYQYPTYPTYPTQ